MKQEVGFGSAVRIIQVIEFLVGNSDFLDKI